MSPGNADSREYLSDTTVFVTTIGDETNFQDCLEKLRAQTVRFPLVIIDRVAPMAAAFQQMLDQCQTKWYVQVDEDMILYPHAIAELRRKITAAAPEVVIYCAPLWDCDAEMHLYGVKIYRTAVVRRFPYANTMSCETDQVTRLTAQGFKVEVHTLEDPAGCLGEHGKHYTPATIFKRWQRLFQKNRALHKNHWVRPYAKSLLERYARTGSTLHLYAALGAIAGITGELPPDRELDFRKENEVLERLMTFFPLD